MSSPSYLPSSYDAVLVAVSFVVASFAAYTALNLAGRVTRSKGRVSLFWLAGGALSMGCGIWSMHFIGMLAFDLPIRLAYDIPLTLLSLAIAIGVSGFALWVVSRPTVRLRRLCSGGVLMGAGIAAMHYTGMAALRIRPGIDYDPWLFGASLAVAVAASIAGLWIVHSLRSDQSAWAQARKVGSALVIGLAVITMHYTGMAAANFPLGSVCMAAGGADSDWLAMTVVLATVMVLSIALLLSIVDSRMSSRTAGLVSSLRDANAQLNHLALHDNLTQLPNRLLLEDRIEQAIASSQRSGKRLAVMFVDLDRFKIVNDSMGHHYGDKLLREVAERLRTTLRAEDTIARVGGDEFIVLAKDLPDAQSAGQMADKVVSALVQPYFIDRQEQNISASVGIAIYPDDGADMRTLMSNADSAMYHAKKMGRNNSQFFTPEMNQAASERLELERALRRAVENDEFELYYQPKVDVASGRIGAMEALVRWRHPTRGIVSPAEFIPLSEELGLIIPLGAWVLLTACQQNKRWQEAGLAPLRVAVNLSAVQFRQRNLAEFVAQILADTGLDPSWLELEVTESVVMQNAEDATDTLMQLHGQGIHISIDDFGTGYSSLSYLKRFPLDTLKIDRSFVRDISTNPDDAAIVKSVIALAHSLRLKVIAEGVETAEQLDYLRSLGCDEYQGYYRSKPVTAAEFEALMRGIDEPALAGQ
jgi:diguanylate cyclase (GGDEF)-like protein